MLSRRTVKLVCKLFDLSQIWIKSEQEFAEIKRKAIKRIMRQRKKLRLKEWRRLE